MDKYEKQQEIKELMQNTGGLQIVAAIYDTESGKVEFDT